MAKESKTALVPKLRFPEFRDDPEWADAKLEELITTITPPAKLPSSNYRQIGKYPIVDQSQHAICGWTDDAFAVIEDAWPLIVFGDHTCALKLIRQPFAQGADGIKIFKARAVVSTEYLFHALNHRPLVMEDYKRHFSILKERRVFYPVFVTGEQQKIADCLSSLDELIAAQGRKVEALKTYKRGLMQQLFPREGEPLPLLRFLDGGDWTEADLPEVAFFQEGPGIMAVDFCTEGVPLVRLAGVGGSVVTLDGCNYLDPEKVARKWAHFRLAVNDLVISTSATFGLTSLVTETAEGAVFYTGLIRFRPSTQSLDRGYLKAFLGSPCFERQVESAAVGGGIKHFGPSHIKRMKIPLPPLPEQQRIANCLDALDTLITAETQKFKSLRTQKTGLMRQLFLSPEEA